MNTSERFKADEKNSRKDSASGCCGGPAPAGTSACCGEDAAIKSTGGRGCGCGSAPQPHADEACVLQLVVQTANVAMNAHEGTSRLTPSNDDANHL